MLSKTSYNIVIERFKAFADGHYLIRRFSHGQIDVTDIVLDNQYPWMHIVPVSMTPSDGAISYEFDVIFADLPRDKETPTEYQRESLSDCIRLAEDLISEIKNGGVIFGTEVTLESGTTIEPFIEEYTHTLTGVNCKLSMQFPNNWSACDIPADWSAGGSGSGGSGGGGGARIILRTNGVENPIQTILDLTEGANMTITDLGDGRIQFDATGDIGTTWGTIGGILSNQTDLQDALDLKVDLTSLAPVATSGDYLDLSNLPSIPTATSELSNDSGFITIGDVPPIPTLTSELTNDSGFITIGDVPPVPTLTSELTNDSGFITIGDVPTQVNADWDATSGVEEILNKPTIPSTLNDLSDVNTPSPTNGQVLSFNTTSGEWEATTPSSGGSVTSVGLSMPSAFSVASSPVTTSGTIAVTGSGASSQYIDGTGALQTFPTLPPTIGDMLKSVYDTDNDGIVDFAEALKTEVRNSTGATLYKGHVVYLSGSTGNLPNAVYAQANNDANSAQTFGVVFADIANNSDGFVITLGQINTLDTRSTAPNAFTSDTLVDGDIVYLSPTTAGHITNVKPSAPQHLVYVGIVIRTSPTNGTIQYRIQNGYELDEIHNVVATAPVDNDYMYYDASTSLYRLRQLTAARITDANAVGQNLVKLANPNAISFIRVNADNQVVTRTPAQVVTDLGISASIILGRDFTGVTISNTTTNTLVFSAEIPANTLQVNDFIELISQYNTNTPNGTATTWRVYANTSAAIGGTQIAFFSNAVGTGNTGYLRNIFITAIGASGNLRITPTSLNAQSPYVLGSVNATNVTINTTASIFIVIAVQMGNATSTAGQVGTLIKLTR